MAIQRFFLGQTFGFANVGKYKFTPVSRTYTAIASNQIGQDYVALVFGDVVAAFVTRPEGPSQNEVSEGASVSTLSGLNTSAGEVPAAVAMVALPEVAVDHCSRSG